MKGPNQTPYIFDILVKFINNPIGLVADTEKAFYQIAIDEVDCDMLHFLWVYDIKKEKPEIVQFRFHRLVFRLIPSPAILAKTIQHHLMCYLLTEPQMANLMTDSFYVASSVQERK